MEKQADIAVVETEEGFAVHFRGVVEHKQLGDAREHAESLRLALESHGATVGVEDTMLHRTHPHLVASDEDPEIEDPEVEAEEVAEAPAALIDAPALPLAPAV